MLTQEIQEIKDIQVQRSQDIQNKCLSKCYPKNCMSSYNLGKRVAEMLSNVDNLIEEGEPFNVEIAQTQAINEIVDQLVEIRNSIPALPPKHSKDIVDRFVRQVWNDTQEDNVSVIKKLAVYLFCWACLFLLGLYVFIGPNAFVSCILRFLGLLLFSVVKGLYCYGVGLIIFLLSLVLCIQYGTF